MLLDVFILACVSLAVVRRDRIGPHVPYVWFVVSLALVVGLLLGYIVTNFGTLFRLRLMVAVPLWMLPLAVSSTRFAAPAGWIWSALRWYAPATILSF